MRAATVSAPWEYAWSSAPAHCGVGGDPSGMLGLGRWFERMPTDAWKKTLQAIADSDETIARLRKTPPGRRSSSFPQPTNGISGAGL